MKRIKVWISIAAVAIIVGVVFILYATCGRKEEVDAKINIHKQFEVDSTAFHDKHLCDGTTPRENFTLAGKQEWIGMTAMLWTVGEDGAPDEFLGYYEFHDVGYGQSTGYGSSKFIKGKSLGTIETGECIDIWMPTEADCEKWGRRRLIIQIFDAKG